MTIRLPGCGMPGCKKAVCPTALVRAFALSDTDFQNDAVSHVREATLACASAAANGDEFGKTTILYRLICQLVVELCVSIEADHADVLASMDWLIEGAAEAYDDEVTS